MSKSIVIAVGGLCAVTAFNMFHQGHSVWAALNGVWAVLCAATLILDRKPA